MAHWSAPGSGQLLLKGWPDQDEWVAYLTSTGDTHLLDPLQSEVIQHLQAESLVTSEIFQRIRNLFHEDDQEQALEYLEATLLQLRDLGLVSSTSL